MSVISRILYISFFLVSFWASSAFAEKRKLTLDEALEGAFSKSPLVAEIERNRSFSKAEAIDVARLPNPSLDAELAIPRSWSDERGDNEVSVSLTQPIKLSHGPLRNRLAALTRSAGSIAREQEILQLTSKVRLAYARLWLLQEREAVLSSIVPKTVSLTKFVETGLSQGAYGKGDAAIFKSEVARTEAELSGIQAEKFQGAFELTKLTGIDSSEYSLLSPTIPTVSIPTVETKLDSDALKIFTRTQTLLDLARAGSEVANRDAFPELRPRIFFSRSDAGTNYLGVGLSIDLPFYSQNSAERIRKASEVSVSSAQLTFVKSPDFKHSVVSVANAFNLRRQEVETYRTKVLPNIESALSAFEEQVRNGQGSVFQLWQTSQSYLETHERFLELWARAFSDYSELSLLVGEEL